MKCTKRRTDGEPCRKRANAGTDACEEHAGIPSAQHKAKGAVVVELRRWGLNGHDELADPGQTLLKLITQSAARAEHYAALLEQAYDAAERLRDSDAPPRVDQVPGQRPNSTDAERAASDLDRIFTTGGVAALIGYKYSSAGENGNLYATEEAIRGLVQLEAQERDRCAAFAVKGIAAGLAERQVRIAEAQGGLVADLVRGVLADLDALLASGRITSIDPAAPDVVQVVSARLRALEAS